MENEIKVNEYMRTKRGIIDRVDKISADYIFLKSKFFITEYGESSIFIKKTDIVKHSPNLIDIIEERRLCKWNISNRERKYIIVDRNKRNRQKWISYTH